MKFLLLVLFCVVPLIHLEDDYIHMGWYSGLSAIAIILSIRLWQSGHRLFSVAMAYFTLNALYIACNRHNRYFENPIETRALFSNNALYFLFAGYFFLEFYKGLYDSKQRLQFYRAIENALGWSSVVNSLSVICGFITGTGKLDFHGGYSGFIDYESVNGVLIACTLPFIWRLTLSFIPSLCLTLIGLFAIYLTGAAAPVVVLTCLVFFWVMSETRKRLPSLSKGSCLVGAIILSLCVFAAGSFVDQGIVDDTGRFAAWRVFMKAWGEKLPVIWGSGPGTYPLFAVETQLETGYNISREAGTGSFWIYLHNEWLQTLYESGVIGLGLVIGVYLKSGWSYFKRGDYLHVASLLGYGASSLVVFPTRYFYGALVGAYLLFRGEFGLSDEG